jgi:hypothetical protein
MADTQVNKWIGGSPLSVIVRLVLVSVLVGVILAALGFDPWDMGFDAIRWLWRYFLLGAVIVIPIWIIMRLINTPRGR